MSFALELLGKGLEGDLMRFILPFATPLTSDDLTMLQQAINKKPDHIANQLRLAIHFVQSGSTESAEKVFDAILKYNPSHLDAHLARASMYASSGDLDKAIEQLEEAQKFFPEDVRIIYGIAHCLERQGEIDRACEHYLRVAHSKPSLKQAWQRLAAIELYRNDLDQAIGYCNELKNRFPEDAWNYMISAQLSFMNEDYKKAIEDFEKGLLIEPENFDDRDDDVETMVKDGNMEQAIELVKQAIEEENGAFPTTYVRLGDLYSQIGADKESVMSYNHALEIYPGYLEAAVKLGTQHMRMHRYHLAAESFNNAVEINDRIIAAYIGLGVSQFLAGSPEIAEDTFDLACALEPNTNLLFAEINRLHIKLAIQNNQITDIDQSQIGYEGNDLLDAQFARYRRGLEANPNKAELHYNYAILLRSKGMIDNAIRHYTRALETNPSFQRARFKLGMALREKKEFERATSEFVKGMQVGTEHCELHYKLALMYCDKLQFAMALEHIEANPQDAQGGISLGANLNLALQNMGLVNRADAAWRMVCELDPQSTLAFHSQRKSHMTSQI
ncbi:MAG: tetratricopeptide repeat protein [Sedimentisphaerales bacterium]|nr:tetratricopeptide repeat protein [Sedimentisphaerales bacterium]MBN2842610.1 tetratricopeptide repeat protein [Sedimentisphaerales bacterium]